MKPLELPSREDMLAAFQEGPEAVIALFEAQNVVIRQQQEIIEQLLARLQALEDQIKKTVATAASHHPAMDFGSLATAACGKRAGRKAVVNRGMKAIP